MRQPRYYMLHAEAIKKLSDSKKRKVGATLATINDKIVAGFNFLPDIINEPMYAKNVETGRLEPNPKIVHAETAVLYRCAKLGISTLDAHMYITCAPCLNCAKAIVYSGIAKVFYGSLNKNDGLDFLKAANIECTYLRVDT